MKKTYFVFRLQKYCYFFNCANFSCSIRAAGVAIAPQSVAYAPFCSIRAKLDFLRINFIWQKFAFFKKKLYLCSLINVNEEANANKRCKY